MKDSNFYARMPVFKLVDYQTVLKMGERDVEKHCEKKKLYRRTDEWTVATSWRIYLMLRTAGFQSFYNLLLALTVYVLIDFFSVRKFSASCLYLLTWFMGMSRMEFRHRFTSFLARPCYSCLTSYLTFLNAICWLLALLSSL